MIALAVYLVLVGSALLAIVRGNKSLLYVAAFSFPLSVSMPEPLGTVSSPLNVVMIGLVLLVAFHKGGRRPLSDRLPLKKSVTLMILALVLGLAIHGFREMSGVLFTRPFYEIVRFTWHWTMPLFLYMLAFRAMGPGFVPSRLINACGASMLLECALAVYERASGADRASAHLGEDNQAGAYFAAAAAYFLAHFLMSTGAKRFLYFGAWLLAIGGVFATLSRGGLVAVAAGITFVALLFLVFEGRKAGTKFLFLILLIVAAMNFAIIIPADVKGRVLETFGGPGAETDEDLDISARQRLEYWDLAIDLFEEGPFGWGTLAFPDMLLERHGTRKTTHNVYLLILVEQGVQGFVVFLAMILLVLGELFRTFRRAVLDEHRMLALALLGWWSAHLVAHLFLNSFFTPMVVGQFWMLLACLFAFRTFPAAQAKVRRAA